MYSKTRCWPVANRTLGGVITFFLATIVGNKYLCVFGGITNEFRAQFAYTPLLEGSTSQAIPFADEGALDSQARQLPRVENASEDAILRQAGQAQSIRWTIEFSHGRPLPAISIENLYILIRPLRS
jgi:hypothetical protein